MMSDRSREAVWIKSSAQAGSLFNSGNQPDFSYFSGRRTGPDGVTYVSVGITGGAGFDGRARQFIQVAEPATTQLGKVKIDAKAIETGLKRDGKMALYGVNFDTNKAVLRDDSAAQLGEMATVLKSAPTLKVFIVGHTDNQGEFAANTTLSQKRADAVVAALSAKYGIAPARLIARGVANLAPVAANDNDDGRARNRRVEMVVR
jgi:OOP family OmpA-OmpF porin